MTGRFQHAGKPNPEQAAIVADLAKELYEAEARLDPGGEESQRDWSVLEPATRAFFIECVWVLLKSRDRLERLLRLTDSD